MVKVCSEAGFGVTVLGFQQRLPVVNAALHLPYVQYSMNCTQLSTTCKRY